MENKRKLGDMSFIDKKGNLVYPSREKYEAMKSAITEPIGKAYGFFDCDASKDKIEEEIPFIREYVKTPNKLELSLIEGVENLKGDKELMDIAKVAKESGIKYVLDAKYPNATNEKTADELSAILNQAYQSPLYKDAEEFTGAVVYKENNEYIFI